MRFQLTPSDRDALHELWRRMRYASHQTNLASAKWNRISDELNDLAVRAGWNDDVTAANRNASRALGDAFGAWSFWEREVSRLTATIQAEMAVRTMFGLVDDEPDPTGLLYSRTDEDDDEPVRRPTRPHLGFSIVSPGRAEQAARRRNSHPHAGEADARLDTAAPTVVREAPTGAPTPVGAGDRSPGRPGPQPSGARVRRASGTSAGGTVAGAAVPPALRGGGSVW